MGVRNEINIQEYVSNAGYVIFSKICNQSINQQLYLSV